MKKIFDNLSSFFEYGGMFVVIMLVVMLASAFFVFKLDEKPEIDRFTQKEVEVEIVDAKYYPETIMFNRVGKVNVPITTSSESIVTVKYNEETYDIDNSELYQKYKDKIGEKAIGILQITNYVDNSVEKEIIDLK